MPVSKEEDRHLAKNVRSMASRINLDICEMEIMCGNGNIELYGKVRAPRGAMGSVNVRKEFLNLVNVVRNVRGVKDVQFSRVNVIE